MLCIERDAGGEWIMRLDIWKEGVEHSGVSIQRILFAGRA